MSVIVEGEASSEATVDSGVPKGTVLGTLLFLCHINDIPDCVSSYVRLFADECLLFRTLKSQEDRKLYRMTYTTLSPGHQTVVCASMRASVLST